MRSIAPYVFIIFSMLTFSCDIQGDEDIGLDLQSQKDAYGVYYTDTLTVETSTVLIDSISTTNTGYLIAGQYIDKEVGKVTANSFFGVGIDEASSGISTQAVFDSLVLQLAYDTYSYGDTNQVQSLFVYQLTDQLAETDTYYGFDKVAYGTNSIGSKVFKATPLTQAPLRIRLTDNLGQEMFTLAKNGQLSLSTDVKAYLKGLALIPGTGDNGAVLRFDADSDSTIVRLYYHENNQDTEQFTYDFKISNGGTYFNHFANDRSTTQLASLDHSLEAIRADSTDEKTYIQGGISFGTRIDIPYLRQLKELGNFAINGAALVIQPVNGTYSKYMPLPPVLTLYEVNASNWVSAIPTQPYLYLQEDYINNTSYYNYDLTAYVNAILEADTPSRKGLMLSLESATNQNTLQRIVLGGAHNKEYRAKLRLYYTLAPQ